MAIFRNTSFKLFKT